MHFEDNDGTLRDSIVIVEDNNLLQLFVTSVYDIVAKGPPPEPPVFTRSVPEKVKILEGRSLTLDVKVGIEIAALRGETE